MARKKTIPEEEVNVTTAAEEPAAQLSLRPRTVCRPAIRP